VSREEVVSRVAEALRDVSEKRSKTDADFALEEMVNEVERRLKEVCDEYRFIDLVPGGGIDGELEIMVVRCDGQDIEIHIGLEREVTYVARYLGVRV